MFFKKLQKVVRYPQEFASFYSNGPLLVVYSTIIAATAHSHYLLTLQLSVAPVAQVRPLRIDLLPQGALGRGCGVRGAQQLAAEVGPGHLVGGPFHLWMSENP